MPRLAIMFGLWLLVTAASALTVHQLSLRSGVDALAETGRVRVEQAVERLTSQLASYRIQANLLARHPVIAASLLTGGGRAAAAGMLRDHVLRYGAERIELRDRRGALVASSDGRAVAADSELLAAALGGRLGLHGVLEDGKRRFMLSRGVIATTAPPLGAVILSVDMAELEFEWSLVSEAIGFFNAEGVYLVSNRVPLLRMQDRDSGADNGTGSGTGSGAYNSFPAYSTARIGDHTVRRTRDFPTLPREALVIDLPAPLTGLTARGFIDTAPAREEAFLRATLSALAFGLVGLAGLTFTLWRRRVSDLLEIQTSANAELERRVQERTTELKTTQHQLIQASKMTALGELSAGISHELNQPLSAITNFADNAVRFLEKGHEDKARGNLALISGQVGRITRIIRNLRAFARNEDERLEPVDLAEEVRAGIALVQTAIDRTGTDVRVMLPHSPASGNHIPGGRLMVMGGRVRLQQVIVNLLTNALDATRESASPRIFLSVFERPGRAIVRVRDTGPGISEPARVFEPFYTTKELGASKGLGLGLSISYGIIGSFGGDITAQNASEGGAIFEVSLPLAGPESRDGRNGRPG